jgi:hypothetical protein
MKAGRAEGGRKRKRKGSGRRKEEKKADGNQENYM